MQLLMWPSRKATCGVSNLSIRVLSSEPKNVQLATLVILTGLGLGCLGTLEIQGHLLLSSLVMAGSMALIYSRPKLKMMALCSIFFAPFMAVFSLNVGVQLYISFGLILLSLPVLFIRTGLWRGSSTTRMLHWALGVFVSVALVSSIIGYVDLGSWHSLANIEDEWNIQSKLGSPLFNILRENFKLLILYGAFLVIVVSLRTEKDVSMAVKVYVVSACLQALYSVYTIVAVSMGFEYLLLPGTFMRGRGAGTFGEPVFFGAFMTIAVFLNVYLIRLGRIWAIVFMMNIAGLLLSFSTAAYFALGVGMVTMLFRRRSWKPVSLAAIVIGIIVYSVSSFFPSKYLEGAIYKPFFNNPSRLERLSTAKAGLRAWEERPIFGVGHGVFPYIRGDLAPIEEIYGARPNNVYLDILAETGTVGILVSIWVFSMLLVGISKCRHAVSESIRRFGLIGLPLLLSLATSFLGLQSIKYFFIWALLGILGAAFNIAAAKETPLEYH